jgi:hypothetical protein
MTIRYHLRLPDPALARGAEPALSFHAHGAEEFAAQLQAALRDDALFRRWRDAQAEPDNVDPLLGATDPGAQVSGEQRGLQIDLVALTALPSSPFKHRLRLLAGSHWELRDVSAA